MACAIIFAGIIVVLLQNNKEGFKEGAGLMQGRLKRLSDKSTSVADSQTEGFKEGAKQALNTEMQYIKPKPSRNHGMTVTSNKLVADETTEAQEPEASPRVE